MRRWFLLILATVTAQGSLVDVAFAQHAAATPPAARSSVDASLRALFEKAGVQAAAWSVVKDGNVIAQSGFGFADLRRTRPVDARSTVFRGASNGKIFVALAALIAASDGRLNMHADVNSILKEAKVPAKFDSPVTMHHLLTHTAGFEDRFIGALARSPETVLPLSRYLAARMPERVFPPGQWLAYSNHGMALGGLVVQDATGSSFDDFAEARIFAPLGMKHSTFKQPPARSIRDALVRDARGEGPWLNPYPAGSLVTTAEDMGRFLLALLGATGTDSSALIPAQVRSALFDRHYSAHPGMPGVAYGFFEGSANGHHTLHHTGDGGSHSLLWLMPDQNAGLFVVYTPPTNGSTAEPREKAAAIVADWLVPPASFKPFKLPAPPAGFAARATRYAGIYRPTQLSQTTIEKLGALPRQITITNRGDGTLGVSLGLGADPEILVETAPLLFRSADGAYVAFAEAADGRIIGLTGTAGTVDDPLSAVRVHWFDDSRLHLGIVATALLVVLARLLIMVMESLLKITRRLRPQAARTDRPRDGWAWPLSGIFALLCIAAPLSAVVGIIAARGPIYQLPRGVYLALSLLALASLLGLILVPFTMRAWSRKEGTRWHRVILTAVAAAGVATGPFLYYWNLLGFHA